RRRRGRSGSLSGAWTKATFDGGDHDEKQINSVPERMLFARLSYEHRSNGSVTLELQHVGRQWADEANEYPVPDYTVANLALTQAVGAVELFGSVRNVTDEKYATLGYVVLEPVYFPASGRAFTAGLRMRIGD
ncbi:MAG: TonB-dependent receptor, partial [Candidatus Eisenbacteria bacterium]|nr:TonB-dependent receptor [Candidatus Eisenbacteria bacterium]